MADPQRSRFPPARSVSPRHLRQLMLWLSWLTYQTSTFRPSGAVPPLRGHGGSVSHCRGVCAASPLPPELPAPGAGSCVGHGRAPKQRWVVQLCSPLWGRGEERKREGRVTW